jgi:hypothetical protein
MNFVCFADDLQTSDGHLYVTQEAAAVYSNQTGQFHVELKCGTFTYPTRPAFDATWGVCLRLTHSPLKLTNSVSSTLYQYQVHCTSIKYIVPVSFYSASKIVKVTRVTHAIPHEISQIQMPVD